MHREIGAGGVQRQRLISLGRVFGRDGVGFIAGPPDADHLVARIGHGRRFLQRRRVHHAPAPQQHEIGPVLADLQPGRLLLDPGMGHRQQFDIEAVLLAERLQQRDRLLAVGRVVIHESNLLALELVPAAADLLGNVRHRDIGRVPIRAKDRKRPRDHIAVAAFAAAIAAVEQRDLVPGHLFHQRIGDPGRERHEQRGAGRTLALEPLIAFDAAIGRIAGLAFLGGDLDAVDAAVALVDQLQVIGDPVGERDAVRCVRSGAVDQRRNELLILRNGRRGHREHHAEHRK